MNDQTVRLVKNEFLAIPFAEIILPYTENFLNALKKDHIPVNLINKLHLILLDDLSIAAEVTLQEELELFINNGHSIYEDFVVLTSILLPKKYPVLDKILKTSVKNFIIHIQNIFSNFSKDFEILTKVFSLHNDKSITINDIDTSLGDGHKGESTVLVTLSDGTRLIYKPRNIDAGHSYNLFIDWVNDKLNTNLKTLKCVCFEKYGWLEFVAHKAVNQEKETEEYYYKAGILLAVAFLLGSKDYHYENIIAAGKDPVIIDHETIIQPILSDQSIRTWDEQHKIPFYSVLESMLIVNKDTGVPLEYAGYGINGNKEIMDIESKVSNPNTIDSKRVTQFVFRKVIKQNIPLYKDTHVFANSYESHFIKGFTNAYEMFMNSKEELTSTVSPIHFFEHQKIRYVWRPTFIYFKILKYMRKACFMSDFEEYRSKLLELMSKAYQKENFKDYRLILESEMKQMLNGDIPFFSLNSLDLHLEEDSSFKIFKYDCLENIRHRIKLLSENHKIEQIELIKKWLTM
ncbi:type 2 lanthipeptide synthetase LanM [Flavobacterium limi]|uniref:Lantibiotic biosynthesis protein dehydration domain-containing protein n=1 Tax=Flavobacterium limi TaxID=2045105 RepID=A0ABQ1TWN1_9FLAO|nr:type 2 lanthipeptide synthetase LanM [Flavobacterium limi]GGF05396.1 hypothetical protein GCM10011518_13270 [Flavobacterium limi]